MSQNRFYSSTASLSALTAGITNATTTFSVTTATGFPASTPFTLILERDTANEEVITVTGITGTAVTCTRGSDGTAAVAHNAGAVVEHGVSARDFNEPQVHIAASSAVHGITGSVVGTSDTQTLTNKTLTSPTVLSYINGNHSHAAGAGGGQLAQANTHTAPDTDVGLTSLHHTLGVTSFQAAAGDHTHTQAQSHNTPDTDVALTSLHHTLGTTSFQAAAGDHTHTQAQSHNSPDTDVGLTSLHHTLGTGAFQAAAGVHTHATTDLTHVESLSDTATVLSGGTSVNRTVTMARTYTTAPRVVGQVRSGAGAAVNATVLVTSVTTTQILYQLHLAGAVGADTAFAVDLIAVG